MATFDRKNIFTLIVCIIISFIIFGNTIHGDFVFDDNFIIIGNPFLDRDIPDFIGMFQNPYNYAHRDTSLYRPLTLSTFGLQNLLFGPSPRSFHIVNILLHAFNAWLLYLIAKKYLHYIPSLIVSLIFLSLPIHTEAVANIANRTELLVTLFSLLAVYFSFTESKIKTPIFVFLALLSKESGIASLAIIGIFKLVQDNYKKAFHYLIWHLPWIIVYAFLRLNALRAEVISPQGPNITNPLIDASFLTSTISALKILTLYILKTFIPISLSPDYSFNQMPIEINAQSITLALGAIVFMIGGSIVAYRAKQPVFLLSWLIFIAPYFIISNLTVKIGPIMADRLFYLPSAGIILGFIAILEYMLKNIRVKNIFYLILLFVICSYGYTTHAYNQAWLTQDNIISYGYKVSPNSVVMKAVYAQDLFQKGDKEAGAQLIDEVLNEVPNFAFALNIKGNMYFQQNDIKKAEEYWLKSINAKSNAFDPYINLGKLYYRSRNFTAAEDILTRSVQIYPLWEHVQYLGLVKIKLGKYQEAIDLVTNNFGPDPDNQALVLVLGLAHRELGNTDSANYYLKLVTDPRVKLFLE